MNLLYLKNFLILLFLLIYSGTYAQRNTKTIEKINGDVNFDGISDLIKISSKLNSNGNTIYILEIFISSNNGTLTKILTSSKAIEPFVMGNSSSFAGIKINKGIIIITTDLMRGYYASKFKFSQGQFIFIGYDEHSGGGNRSELEHISYNAITGQRTIKIADMETDKIISFNKKIIKIRPIFTLQNFTQEEFSKKLFSDI